MERSDQSFRHPNIGQERPFLYFNIIRPSLAEFVGVYFLTFCLYAACVLMMPTFASIAVVFLYIGVYSITRTISGGHLNPIITLVQMVRLAIPPVVGIFYIISQLGGGVLGALSVRAITHETPMHAIEPSRPTWNAIFAEMIGTTIVILAYLTLATKGKGNTAILGIGFGYAGALFAVTRASAGYLNPVLNFGIAVTTNNWTKHHVYWLGTMFGGILATLFHGLIFASDDQLWISLWMSRRNLYPERIA